MFKVKNQKLIQLAFIAFLFPGCSNIFPSLGLPGNLSFTISASPSPYPSSSSTSRAQIFLSTVSTTSSGAQAGATPSTTFNLFLDSVKSASKISAHCNQIAANSATPGTVAKPCSCQFSWTDTNPNNLNLTATPRSVLTSVASVSDYQVSCPAPDVYSVEIANGTQIKVSIVPSITNPNSSYFAVNPYNYIKNNSSTGANFQDRNGNFYTNILRYSCFQSLQKGMVISSKPQTNQNPTSSALGTYLYSTQFCVSKSGGGSPPQGCPNSTPDYSSQSNYFNLYIRSSEAGAIQQYNSQFTCPTVKEPLSGSTSNGAQGNYWPLDSTFALSLGPTTTFAVGVVAQSKLDDGQGEQSSTCYPTATATGTAGGINASVNNTAAKGMISTCLGFAALPNPDGTCPSFNNLSNQVVPTYRLRRFVALYPRYFDSAGWPFQGLNQGIDTVYILDRPIKNSKATYAGPKPCPFAYFDRMNVTLSSGRNFPNREGYIATNDPAWNGKNIDGIEFPNVDGPDRWNNPSCSATLPILVSNDGVPVFTFQTINKNNTAPNSRSHAYIRPVQAFTPYYLEDTQFRACAPQASPLRDAPLHFARDPVTNQMAWCAEAYPTQNDNLASLDPPFVYPGTPSTPLGNVSPFTSHIIKNSAGSCSATSINLPKNYVGNRVANHPSSYSWDGGYASQTCDRTVLNTNSPGGLTAISPQARFPLLARALDVETALTDPSSTQPYQCLITYDPTGGRTYPSGGCCATGVITGTPAHLEPTQSCGTPDY